MARPAPGRAARRAAASTLLALALLGPLGPGPAAAWTLSDLAAPEAPAGATRAPLAAGGPPSENSAPENSAPEGAGPEGAGPSPAREDAGAILRRGLEEAATGDCAAATSSLRALAQRRRDLPAAALAWGRASYLCGAPEEASRAFLRALTGPLSRVQRADALRHLSVLAREKAEADRRARLAGRARPAPPMGAHRLSDVSASVDLALPQDRAPLEFGPLGAGRPTGRVAVEATGGAGAHALGLTGAFGMQLSRGPGALRAAISARRGFQANGDRDRAATLSVGGARPVGGALHFAGSVGATYSMVDGAEAGATRMDFAMSLRREARRGGVPMAISAAGGISRAGATGAVGRDVTLSLSAAAPPGPTLALRGEVYGAYALSDSPGAATWRAASAGARAWATLPAARTWAPGELWIDLSAGLSRNAADPRLALGMSGKF